MSSSLFSFFQENTKCLSCFFADTCTRRVPIFVSAKQIYCYRKRNVNVTVSLAIQRRAYIIEPI